MRFQSLSEASRFVQWYRMARWEEEGKKREWGGGGVKESGTGGRSGAERQGPGDGAGEQLRV